MRLKIATAVNCRIYSIVQNEIEKYYSSHFYVYVYTTARTFEWLTFIIYRHEDLSRAIHRKSWNIYVVCYICNVVCEVYQTIAVKILDVSLSKFTNCHRVNALGLKANKN